MALKTLYFDRIYGWKFVFLAIRSSVGLNRPPCALKCAHALFVPLIEFISDNLMTYYLN